MRTTHPDPLLDARGDGTLASGRRRPTRELFRGALLRRFDSGSASCGAGLLVLCAAVDAGAAETRKEHPARESSAAERSAAEVIRRAGNAESEKKRYRLLRKLRDREGLSRDLRSDLDKLLPVVDWWAHGRRKAIEGTGGEAAEKAYLNRFFSRKARIGREEMRWWTPVLVGFRDPKITAAQRKLSEAILARPHMEDGYTSRFSDVEHTAEETADSITPMIFLAPDEQEWRERALRIVELAKSKWMGRNDRGFLQFKSTWFNADRVGRKPRRACDTVYHPRVFHPALIHWLRSGDEKVGDLITRWMDTWVDAAAREENGKPAGIVPSAVHWPDGEVGGGWTPGGGRGAPATTCTPGRAPWRC